MEGANLRTMILRCWEDAAFPPATERRERLELGSERPPERLASDDRLKSCERILKIHPPPIAEWNHSGHPTLLAFWESVFETASSSRAVGRGVADDPLLRPDLCASSSHGGPIPGRQLSADELCAILTSGQEIDQACFEANFSSVPFGDLLQPLVGHAFRSIAPLAAVRPGLSGALPGLGEQLLRRLSSVASLPLYLWFHLYRDSADAAPYGAFRASMQCGEGSFRERDSLPATDRPTWSGLFSEYPELARLLAAMHAQWIGASEEFLQRLIADSALLLDFLGLPAIAVESVAAGLSDCHHAGRSVLKVTLVGGRKLAYKPRLLEAEAALSHVLLKLAADGLGLPHAKVLPREGYGWMTWLEAAAAGDAAAWYARAGMLQSLLQTLGMQDAHMGNCVATASGPALVDCECMLTPAEASAGFAAPNAASPDIPATELRALVARIHSTSFLPQPERKQGEPELSGLFGSPGQAAGCRIPVWTLHDSGGIHLRFESALLRPQANLLLADSAPLSKMAAGQAFFSGFARMQEHLASHGEEMLSAIAPLRHRPTRILLRNTRQYTQILSDSIHPRLLRDRVARRQAIIGLLERERPPWSQATTSILAAEAEALEGLDVPLVQARDCDLFAGTRLLEPGFFRVDGYEAFRQRLHAMGPEQTDMALQALRLLWIMAL